MRSIILVALLMPAAASAQWKSTDTQQLNNETRQQTALSNKISTQTISNKSPETNTKQTAKAKSNSQRMDLLTFLMLLKDGKK